MSSLHGSFRRIIVAQILLIGCQSSNTVSKYDVIRTLLINYGDPSILPDVQPVNVSLEMFISSNPVLLERGNSGSLMLEIDNLWMVQKWHDKRLNFEKLGSEKYNVTLPYEQMSKIWIPEISTVNDKKFEVRQSPTPNIYTFIVQNGTVIMSTRALIQVPCTINCHDKEVRCKLMFESGIYNIEEVRLDWNEGPIFILSEGDDGMMKWSLDQISTKKQTNTYPLGEYDDLMIEFIYKPIDRKCNLEA